MVDDLNNRQFTNQIKPILDEPRIPDDFIMCRGAYGQCLYVIPSRELVVVRNAPATVREIFEDDEFLRRLLGDVVTSVSEPGRSALRTTLFPNPTNGTLHILSVDAGILTFTVYSAGGGKIHTGKTRDGIIRLPELPDGNYYIQLTDANGRTGIHPILLTK